MFQTKTFAYPGYINNIFRLCFMLSQPNKNDGVGGDPKTQCFPSCRRRHIGEAPRFREKASWVLSWAGKIQLLVSEVNVDCKTLCLLLGPYLRDPRLGDPSIQYFCETLDPRFKTAGKWVLEVWRYGGMEVWRVFTMSVRGIYRLTSLSWWYGSVAQKPKAWKCHELELS